MTTENKAKFQFLVNRPGFVDTQDQAIVTAEVSEMARQRRTFFPEFKEETVALVLDMGMSMRQVARDLDIGASETKTGTEVG